MTDQHPPTEQEDISEALMTAPTLGSVEGVVVDVRPGEPEDDGELDLTIPLMPSRTFMAMGHVVSHEEYRPTEFYLEGYDDDEQQADEQQAPTGVGERVA